MVKLEKDQYYLMQMGHYCGLLIREHGARKIRKLLYKQKQELKEALRDQLDMNNLEIHSWALAYPDGEQTSVVYFLTNDTREDKLRRIALLDKVCKLERIDYTFSCSDYDEKQNALEPFAVKVLSGEIDTEESE